MPDKNVQLPDGRVVVFPDSMANADISAVIKKQLGAPKTERAMQQTMGGPPMFVDVPVGKKEEFEAAGKASYSQGGKLGLEMVGGAVGGEAALGVRGLTGVVLRMLGAGAGAGVGDVAGQVASTGRTDVDLSEAAKTGLLFTLFQGGGEALSGLKGA